MEYEVPKVRCRIIRDWGSSLRCTVNDPKKVYDAIKEYMEDFDVEHLVVVNVDAQLTALSFREIGIGSYTECIAHIPSIFKTAILENATGVILAHNHPSGNPVASEEDLKLTKRVADAGEMLQIKLIDHLIVTNLSYYSLRDTYPELFK